MEEYLKTSYDLNNKELVSVIDELPLWSAHFGLRLLDKIKYRKNITALDIGFGLGFPLLEVAMRLGNSCKVYGIDPWEAAVDRTKTKMKIYEITNVDIITGAAEKISLPDNSVDLIFSNNGLNNVNDLKVVLKECTRISKIGAQLVFTFNTDKTMVEFYSVLENVLREKNMLDEISLMQKHIYKKRKPVEELQLSLKDGGFSVKEILYDEFSINYTDGATMFNHFLIKLAFLGSWKAFIPEERLKEIFAE
ncbi:MAG: class I SAM-dependent methyltransferase, partial [Ignavibacteriaceae bacterium]|nr:class I SAM-dependent methyltransferase [Ignavibacteriaceae bacterium]